MKQMNFGILGAARIAAGALIPAIGKASNARVVAVAARDGSRAKNYAAQHGIRVSYDDYDTMLADPKIEAIYNPLPGSLHAPWTIRALKAGKHVLCEKSFSLNAAEAEEVAQVSKKTGKMVMEAFMWRFHPQVQTAKQIIASGEIGELTLIRPSFSFLLQSPGDIRWVAKLGGGAIFDIGTYCVSGSRTFAGREPLSVAAYASWTTKGHSGGGNCDYDCVGVLDFGDGLRSVFDCSFAQPFKQRVELVGSKGSITLTEPWVPGRDTKGRDQGHGTAAPHLLVNGKKVPSVAADQYQLMVEHFVRAARGKEALKYPVEDSIRQARVLDAVFASVRKGKTVKVG
jgi:predicted dehydrogenase